jgi:hypothetical protein
MSGQPSGISGKLADQADLALAVGALNMLAFSE